MTRPTPPAIGILIGSLEAGGAQRAALELARGLRAAGWEVRLIALDRDREMALPGTPEEQAALEARLHVLGRGSARGSTLAKALAFPRLRARLERLVAAEDLAAVVSFMERANLLNLLGPQRVVRIVSVRKQITMALAAKPGLKRWLVVRAYPLLLRRAAAVVFNARGSAADFTRRFTVDPKRVAVIHNAVDPGIVAQARAAPAGPGADWLGPQTVVSAGRLVADKGQVPLLRAFARVAAQVPDARLIVLGEGPLRPRLTALAAELGLADRVALPGFQANPHAWVARAGVFALPSRAEGFPNALLEALRLGRASVAADCPTGPRELLAPDTPVAQTAGARETTACGILLPPMPAADLPAGAPLTPAETALADALVELLQDGGLRDRLGAAAAAHAAAYSPEAALEAWQALLRRHLPAARPAAQ
jgi:glycosyltransferase involved in cell wall biosynthesis